MPDFGTVVTQDLLNLTYSLFGLTAVRIAMGVFAALKDGTFVLSKVGAALQSHVLGRVLPILTTAYFAQVSANGILIAAAGAAGALYVGESVGAIREALSASAQQETAEKIVVANELGNPVPR